MESELKEKEYYKQMIIDVVEKIERVDLLVYLYAFIKGKVKAE